jgi:hypothetical protein
MKFSVRAAVTLGILLVTLPLSGCLVHKAKKPKKTYQRTSDYLRSYQDGDYINYNVTTTRYSPGATDPVILHGTMKIRWERTANLINPLQPTTQYQVLKEVTTITYNNNGGSEGVVHYIQQDSSGSVKLVAIDDSGGERFWFNTTGNTDLNTVSPMTVFDSPLDFTGPSPSSPIDFYIIEGCGTPPCERQIAQFEDNIDILGDTTSIETNIGIFANPLEMTFSGSMTPVGDVAAPQVDIRYACSSGFNFVTHDTKAYVFPSLGMVKMTNTCTETTGDTVYYVFTLSDTNIPLPAT